MSILLTVLAVIGYILLAILLIVFILLILPVHVLLEYKSKKFTAILRIFFIKIQVFPLNKKEDKKVEKAEKKAEGKVDKVIKKEKKKINFILFAEDIFEIIATAGTVMSKIIRSLSFTKITLIYPVHKTEAADTAVFYGRVNAYVGTAIGTLHNYLRMKIKNVEIICDYDNIHEDKTYVYCDVSAVLISILTVFIYALIRLKREKVF